VGRSCNTSGRGEKGIQNETLNARHNLVDLDVDGRVILKVDLKKYSARVWTGFVWLRIGISGGEHGNEPSGSIKGEEFLTS
jgi:hypothetical protein